MESLPLEILEMITQHLSAKDLAACCATSRSWRNFFNQDLFWKPLCKQETAVYLSRAPCLVKPAFISPEVEGSGLELVCQWRMNYMRQNHLLNNWRSGRCHEEEITFSTYNEEVFPRLNLFYEEEFLITVGDMGLEVCIWDLRCDLVNYVEDPCPLLPTMEVNKLFLCGNRLVVAQGPAVLVVQINLMKQIWPLESVFFFKEEERTDLIIASEFTLHTDLTTNSYTFVVGNYLLATHTDSSMYLHIWDIVNGSKLKKESLDNGDCSVSKIKPSTTSLDDIIVYRRMTDIQYAKVLVYSLLSFTCYPCVFEGADYSDLHRDKIIVKMKIPHDYWLIANYKTGEQLHRIEGLSISLCYRYEVFDNKLMYETNSRLNMVNLSTGEMKQFLDFGSVVDYFKVAGNKYIYVKIFNEDPIVYDALPQDRTSVSKRLVAVSNFMLNKNYVKSNTALTKLFLQQGFHGTIISFW